MSEDNFTFFYGGIYSQWSPHGFYDFSGQYYTCAEQYMMSCKALTFEDADSYEKIMVEESPYKQKALGKKVKNFNKAIWEVEALNHVVEGNYFKFTQNISLFEELMQSGNSVIVEASPTDEIWGIGMYEGQSGIEDSDNWKGTNWLGIAIMRVRMMLFNLPPYDMEYMETK